MAYQATDTGLIPMASQAASHHDTVKVLDDCRVSPPHGSVPTTSLPLTFFDVKFLPSDALQPLKFYEFPLPSSFFMEHTLPILKTSLSLTLQRFFPLAGNLVYPPHPQSPYLLYSEGDSVSLLVKETTADFSHLASNHARHFQELQALVPRLPPAVSMPSSNCKKRPVMAVQITIFPKVGICIGFAFSHVVADGRALAHFTSSWGSAFMSQGDMTCLDKSPPNFNRDLIKDPLGLASNFVKEKWVFKDFPDTSVDKVRITSIIKRFQVELLKDWVQKRSSEEIKGSEPLRLSTFVVTCAYMWVCLLKLQDNNIESPDHDNELSHFIIQVDCRDRLRLPANYFGNCLIFRSATAKKSDLVGENGIVVAAATIAKEIMELNKGRLTEADMASSKVKDIFRRRSKHVFMVVASPKLGLYNADFGSGRPIKTEMANLGASEYASMISITESKEGEGGVEFGLALAPDKLDSFNAIFDRGLLKVPSAL